MTLNYPEINKAFSSQEFKDAMTEAEMEKELERVIDEQVYGGIDWVRARAYWKTRLPLFVAAFGTDALAQALTGVLSRVHATRSGPDRSRYGLPR